LAAGKNYRYYFTARDSDGKEAPQSIVRKSPTVDARADIAPPALTAISMGEATARTVVIRWQTDEPATSMVEFGTQAEYGAREPVDGLEIQHAVTLGGLQPATTYHYRIVSADESGNKASSGDYTFTTKGE
ncbi:MAG: fibronectin type III domain-containing protein, partial [Lentisphaeria bacterium]|nr:fibronectin type III domain-containing protein [Lentisphaeria bacterium]